MAIHIKNLKIDSYRGVKKLELNNLADINVLTGIIIRENKYS